MQSHEHTRLYVVQKVIMDTGTMTHEMTQNGTLPILRLSLTNIHILFLSYLVQQLV